MAEGKKSFILYADLITVIEKLVLKDREDKTNYAGELFLHILKYVNDQNPVPIDFIIDMAFEPIKLALKRDLAKYETFIKKQTKNGAKGGRPKKTQKTQPFFGKPKKPDSVSVSVSDSVSDNKKKKYIRPSLEDVKKYFSEKGYRKDVAEHAFNYYEANDWNDSKGTQVKAWKQKMIGVWFKPENLDKQPSTALNGEQLYKCTFTNDGSYVRMFTEEQIAKWVKTNPECKIKTKVKA